MPAQCLLCYITDRSAFPGDESLRQRRLLERIREAARAGVDYIQLREKDLSTRELESLAKDAIGAIRESSRLRTDNQELRTALLVNSRTDVALVVGADGVHLRSADISPQDAREMWKRGACARGLSPRNPVVGVSCHRPEEVFEALAAGATFAVFAPVFEKKGAPSAGLNLLREACRTSIPVLALGGVTSANAHSCLAAGASGIAAVRLFQDNDIATVVKQLRG